MTRNDPIHFDVIVVLGAKQAPDGTPGPAIERRMAEAIRLWREGLAPNLILSGGATLVQTPEAESMAAVARAAGVPDEALHLEARSTRTLENAVFTVEILRQRGWRRVMVVTDDFHMRRAVYCFRALGQPVTAAGVRNALTRTVFAAWCREIAGRMIYPRQVRAYLGRW